MAASPQAHAPRPIVVAGGGCVGLFLAHLLARSAIPHRVLVLEPHAPDPSSTRAMAHQPLVFPLFARAGLLDPLSRLGSFSSGLCFRTSVGNGSTLIAGKLFKEGDQPQLLLPQGKFQDLLMRTIVGPSSRPGSAMPKGEVRVGWQLAGLQEHCDCVTVTVQHVDTLEEELIEAEYLLACDGAHSPTRHLLSPPLPLHGETLPTQLVATDIIYPYFHAHGFYDANFIIDPEHYGLIGRIDNQGLWRVSYGVAGDMSEEQIRDGVMAKLQCMLPGDEGEKKQIQVKRIAPYKAQQRCVEHFWTREGRGRIGFCGDAAHLTNPYAGLGLASGIADASSLADVLIRILLDEASSPATLLQSWSDARRDKFANVVDKPSRKAYARVKTRVDTDNDVQALLESDALVGALKKGMPMMPPSLETKCDELTGW